MPASRCGTLGRMIRALAVSAVLAACGFTVQGGVPGDGSGDAVVPDAGPCQALGATCVGGTLRTCSQIGSLPDEQACAWGCTASGSACAALVPGGGTVLPADLDDDAQLQAVTLSSATLDSDSGEIKGVRGVGPGVISGIGYEARTTVGVFRFASLTIDGPLVLIGSRGVALVSLGPIAIRDVIDARGTCEGTGAGPGGSTGGDPHTVGNGPGGGSPGVGSHDQASGGAGGGHGVTGSNGGIGAGNGNAATIGGAAYGDPQISVLRGGSGGGGGGGNRGGLGGGGGGALQLVADGTITFTATGGINAGGCGAKRKSDQDDGGAGGGGGGTILLEAPAIELAVNTALAVNGGSGGGADSGGMDGNPGALSRAQAVGGPGSGTGRGGDGGAPTPLGMTDGLSGTAGGNYKNAGGGGGAAGRIRFHTRGGAIVDHGAVLSPSLSDTNTTTTQGTAVTQ